MSPLARVALALLVGAIGLTLAARHAPLGLCFGGAALAFATGFAAAKLRTEMVRAPVLAHELRYTNLTGFVEAHELRDKGRARITLRVLTLDDLEPESRPYRVRVTLPAKDVSTLEIANLIAAPLVSLLIMPMAVLSLIAMPFGLEAWPLRAMGLGIELMVGAAGEWVASWPGAVTILPAISGSGLVLIVLGGLWVCLWQTRTRALGLVIAAFGIALAPASERPDILIEREGATAALRSDSGNLVFPPATAANYSVDNWLLADGDDRDAAAASSGEATFRCDSLGCIGTVKGKTVALIRHEGAVEEDCRIADIVIAPFTIGERCRAARVIVDRRVLKAEGAHALYIEGLSIRTETVAAWRGHRPWVPDRASVRSAPHSRLDPFADEGDDAADRSVSGNPED